MPAHFASLKAELVDTQPWPTRAVARQAVVEYVGWFGTRLHSTLGYRSRQRDISRLPYGLAPDSSRYGRTATVMKCERCSGLDFDH